MDEAEILARALEILRRRASATPRLTVAQIYKAFAPAKNSLKSWLTVERALRPVIEYFGDRDALSLTVADTEDYRALRRTKKCRHGKGRLLGHKSINFELQWFKTMLTWAVRGGRIGHNPIATAKAEKVQRHRNTSPTEDEIGRLLEYADTIMRVVILLACDSGMRRDEARLCRWDWIDEAAKMITLPAASTKSQRERRVPISGRTLAAFRLLPRHLIKPYVLHNTDGDPFASVTINAWFRKLVDASGVKAAPGDGRVHLHDLRHAYARRNARAGVRIEVISMILGHSTLQQTKDYLQTGDDDIADARETFEESLNGPPKPAQRAKNPDVREDATRSDRESFQP